MLKSTLIVNLADKFKTLPLANVEKSVNAIIHALIEALSSGERIEIRDFGSFCLHYQPPRKAHNPKTGKRLTTTPKYRARFKAGKALREGVNNAAMPIKAQK